jgi:hypothetical protein
VIVDELFALGVDLTADDRVDGVRYINLVCEHIFTHQEKIDEVIFHTFSNLEVYFSKFLKLEGGHTDEYLREEVVQDEEEEVADFTAVCLRQAKPQPDSVQHVSDRQIIFFRETTDMWSIC